MQYDKGKHCAFYHRYHLVWSTKYRFKIMRGPVQHRVREITRQVCEENGGDILKGVVSIDHVHIFVSVPPKIAIGDLMRRIKGRTAFKLFREFPQLKKRYWGCHFLGKGLLLNDQRRHNRRRGTSVLGKAHHKSHRPQPVRCLVPNDVLTGPGQDGTTPPVIGISAADLTADQQAHLLKTICGWVSVQPDENALPRMEELSPGIEDISYAWTGTDEVNTPTYMRIQGPSLIIEMLWTGVNVGDIAQEAGHYHTMH